MSLEGQMLITAERDGYFGLRAKPALVLSVVACAGLVLRRERLQKRDTGGLTPLAGLISDCAEYKHDYLLNAALVSSV